MARYQLYYWGELPGRAEPMRMLLEYVGVEYEDVGRVENGMQKVMQARQATATTCHYAPPILRTPDGKSLSQTAVILAYLGEQHGVIPKDEDGKLTAMQVTLTLLDIMNEAHNTHHPVDSSVTYEEQIPEAIRAGRAWVKKRLPRLLHHLNQCVETYGDSERGTMIQASTTYVDFLAAFVLSGLDFAFPRNMALNEAGVRGIRRVQQRVMGEKGVADYVQRTGGARFGAGIFRHYAALDEVEQEDQAEAEVGAKTKA